jgi:mRNA interferase MazF
MRRGEILLADLEPVHGAEANKRRPVVVVSNDGANAAVERWNRGVVTVVPLTSNTSRVLAFQTFLPAAETGLTGDSKSQPEQVRALDVRRFGAVVGRLPVHLMLELDEALRLHLGL